MKVLKADRRPAAEPQNDMEEVMEEETELDEAMEAKPQRAKPKRPLKPAFDIPAPEPICYNLICNN